MLAELTHDCLNYLLRVGGVFLQVADDHLDGDAVVVGVPAVVVCHHR